MTAAKRTIATTYYSSRHFRVDLLDELRMQAVLRRTSVEALMNEAVEIGLPIIKARPRPKRTAAAAVNNGKKPAA